jgi:hypothetical protein
MPRENPQRRRIRLAPAVYTDIGEICSITIAMKGRTPVFANPAVAAAAGDVLRRPAAATGVPVYAWCVWFSGSIVFQLADAGGGQAPRPTRRRLG